MYFRESIHTFLLCAFRVCAHVSSCQRIEPIEDKEEDYYYEWNRNWYFHRSTCWSKTIPAYFNSNASGFLFLCDKLSAESSYFIVFRTLIGTDRSNQFSLFVGCNFNAILHFSRIVARDQDDDAYSWTWWWF